MVVALKETTAHSDEHINIKRKRQMWWTRHNSGGTYIRYAHNRQIRKHNNILECLGASLNSIADSSLVTVTRGRRTVDLIIIT